MERNSGNSKHENLVICQRNTLTVRCEQVEMACVTLVGDLCGQLAGGGGRCLLPSFGVSDGSLPAAPPDVGGCQLHFESFIFRKSLSDRTDTWAQSSSLTAALSGSVNCKELSADGSVVARGPRKGHRKSSCRASCEWPWLTRSPQVLQVLLAVETHFLHLNIFFLIFKRI